MNEELSESMNRVQKLIDSWDREPTLQTAKDLQWSFTIIKLIIGIEKFAELPAFSRYLKDVTGYIDSQTKEDEVSL